MGHLAGIGRAIGQYRIRTTVKRLYAKCGPTDIRARKESKHRQIENNELQNKPFHSVELSNAFSPILSPGLSLSQLSQKTNVPRTGGGVILTP